MDTNPKGYQDITLDKTRSITTPSTPQNSKNYYIFSGIYAALWSVTGLLIIFAPANLVTAPETTYFIAKMITKMPGLAFLSGLSSEPQEIMFGYCLAWITLPIHLILMTPIAVLRFINGFITPMLLLKYTKLFWIWSALMCAFFFTCFLCDSDPGWRTYSLVSSRFMIAIMGLGCVASVAAYPAILITYILYRTGVITQLHPTNGGRHARQ